MAAYRDQERGREEASRHWEFSSSLPSPSRHEGSPLLRPMSAKSTGALCTCGAVTVLTLSWCILDFWNRKVSSDLFSSDGNVRMLDVHGGKVQVVSPSQFKAFSYPLTLAFLQFVFMGVFFLLVLWTTIRPQDFSLENLRLTEDRRWPSLVVSHVFSTFWLQSLIMPSQVMSLGFFAASRAVEIPVAAALRLPVLGVRPGKRTLQTTGLAFIAACTLYFSYAELAGCVCIMSGNGVALTGTAFWVIYSMILAMPAANAVCQEALLNQLSVHPILLLALQNIGAAILFAPILVIGHIIGLEDVWAALQTMLSYQEVMMLIVWLCAQIAMMSVVSILVIQVVDSFWAIALRPLRVIVWATMGLMTFYMSSLTSYGLSVVSPRSSFWSFMICIGAVLAGAAIFTDRRSEDQLYLEKHGGVSC